MVRHFPKDVMYSHVSDTLTRTQIANILREAKDVFVYILTGVPLNRMYTAVI